MPYMIAAYTAAAIIYGGYLVSLATRSSAAKGETQ